MLPRVRFPFRSRLSPRAALRRLPRPSRRLTVSSTLFPIAVLVALALAKGGPAEGQRAPVTATPWLPEVLRNAPPESKEAFWRYYEGVKQQSAARGSVTGSAIRPTSPNVPTPEPQRSNETAAGDGYITVYQTRASQRGSMPIIRDSVDLETFWQDRLRTVTVHSGASRKDQAIGVLLIHRGGVLSNIITPSSSAGALTIVDAVGYRLTIRTALGQTLYFDVNTEQFISP